MATKVTTVLIRTQLFDVLVDGGGQFIASVEREQLHAPTLEALKQKLMVATKQKSVTMAVAFERLNKNGKTKPGVIYSIHVNGNLLVRWGEDTKGVQERSYLFHSETIARPLTDVERTEWAVICGARDAVEKREHAFRERVRFDAQQAAREEMDKLTGEESIKL